MKFNTYKLWYLFWGIPLFFLGLVIHQYAVYQGVQTTYKKGTSYTADVLNVETMQIVTQNSASVILEFKTDAGKVIQRKLSLPVGITDLPGESKVVPIRYYKDSFQPVILIAAYEDHATMTLVNIAMALFGFIATTVIGWFVHRWVNRRKRDQSPRKLIIDSVNSTET